MAHITVNVPSFRTTAPRGTEFLADSALCVSRGVVRLAKALFDAFGELPARARAAGESD